MDEKIFKAYDVRGRYPTEFNEHTAARIAEALHGCLPKGKVVINHDARLSSSAIYRAVLKTFKEKRGGRALIRGGISTTPMHYFLVHRLGAAGGIIITASHNPKEFNGLKAVKAHGIPISGMEIKALVMKKI